ncbi:protein of unknown function [Pseudobutyrivibrio sp. 49]|uniref:DUF4430 domain-containing protein n=1 Tax=Pseudobutyrivibrio sp. 49 TaxID=1855344 RepID=UPI00088C3E4E|nr:DUF4430 domain-containing protein [Pseudobutyrivibrio sp. 49]SDI65103.1 protein of unknown function [Pseudobutyrivibrio sp. 49]
MEKKSTKKIVVGLVILAALIGGFLLCYNKFAAKGTVGEKAIVIEVVDSNGTSSEYDVNTDAEYLKDAMDELAASDSSFSFSGQEGDYGLMVEVINGEQAIYAEDNAYWALYVNGEYGQYGVTEQPVGDGDTYTWKYESAE